MYLYTNNKLNYALLTDFYELTMMQGYFYYKPDLQVVFDMFFRKQPFNGGYSVFAGLEPFIKGLLEFKFTDDDINYLKSFGIFKKKFLDYLKNFKFNGDIYSVEEGEIVFPNEPLIRVHANILEAQLIESFLLNVINFQSLIATKTARIVEEAKGRGVLEFGLRRAQGVDGAISATRAAFIGGASATSNTLAGKIFNIPTKGTMAHSWVMAFTSEIESFEKYSKLYPQKTIILVDTYDTLNSGLPNAIKILKKLKQKGIKKFGIRLDSGDLEYLSKQARYMLDKAGLKEAFIVVSNELNEHIISQLIKTNAPIDFFGVGTHLITAQGDSSFSGVFKLVAKKEKNKFVPCIKVSNNPEKVTNPGVKNILRLFNENFMIGDLIFLNEEEKDLMQKVENKNTIMFFHPFYDYKCVKVNTYNKGKLLLKKILEKGKIVYPFPSLMEIQKRTKTNLKYLHPSNKRLLNPHIYKVSITKKLMNVKINLIKQFNNTQEKINEKKH